MAAHFHHRHLWQAQACKGRPNVVTCIFTSGKLRAEQLPDEVMTKYMSSFITSCHSEICTELSYASQALSDVGRSESAILYMHA